MPTLQGDYLELRPLPEDHLPALLKIYQGTPLYFDGLVQNRARFSRVSRYGIPSECASRQPHSLTPCLEMH